jgi:hypothetical protein
MLIRASALTISASRDKVSETRTRRLLAPNESADAGTVCACLQLSEAIVTGVVVNLNVYKCRMDMSYPFLSCDIFKSTNQMGTCGW